MQRLDRHNHGERLSKLLKRCRLRIGVETSTLGNFSRLPSRIGKRVTQEEVAEAADVTRQWYARIESGTIARVSPSVLSRIADALMMDTSERTSLFEIALPELAATSPEEHGYDVFDSLRSLRSFTRLLWSASSELEALEVVREFAITELSADIILTRARIAPGHWALAGAGKRYDFDLLNDAQTAVLDRWGDAAIDDLMCFERMARPGQVLTMRERDARFPDLVVKRRPALDVLGWPDVSSAMASIESQSGFVARLSLVHTSARAYSQLEREQLSTVAELASLALSGYVR